VRRPRLPSSRRQVRRLGEVLEHRRRVVLAVHDNPDPDAMAAALCLAHLVQALWEREALIVHGGAVGRASNRMMVDALQIPLRQAEGVRWEAPDAVVLVDTQPGFRNNSVPPDAEVLGVVDHHLPDGPVRAPFADIRPEYGAASSITTQYLVSAGIEISTRLATAICYGISSETQDLGREASGGDIAAFLAAFPLSDQPLLGRLRHPKLPPRFFRDLHGALEAAAVVGDVLICHMPAVSAPEVVAEMADLLLATEGVNWAFATGVHEGRLLLSLRAACRGSEAGKLLRRVVEEPAQAGGHGLVAGGSLALARGSAPAGLRGRLTDRLLCEVGRSATAAATPLLGSAGTEGASSGP
jgi:nanoRNase/pAp phosphatase (c-di-AMP/oligoRNAs hydrolase)